MFSEYYLSSIRAKPELGRQRGYPFSLPVVQYLAEQGEISLDAPVAFFVGKNGTGKSTLLEAVAVAWGFNPEGGTRNFNFSTVETHSRLYRYLTLAKGIKRPKDGFFLRAESFYNVASEVDKLNEEDGMLLQYYGGESLHRRSHGESFLALVTERFGGDGLYLLDEPEAALSPTGQFTLLAALGRLVKRDSQFLIATHSPLLLSFPGAVIYQFSDGGVARVRYEETEHYQLTRSFLQNPQRMLDILLADDES